MITLREKLFKAIDEVAAKAGLEVVLGEGTGIYIQNKISFETLAAIKWSVGPRGEKDLEEVWELRVIPSGHIKKTAGNTGRTFEFEPRDHEKIQKMLGYLDDLLIKKVGVQQALAGAAGAGEDLDQAANK